MARSEHQGLQIALIIFVMLTIILSVTTFMFFKESEKAANKSAEDAKARQADNDSLRKTIDEVNELKRAIGVAESDNIEAVREAIAADMRNWAGTFPEPKQSYRECLTALLDAYRVADEERKRERDELTAMTARVNALEAAKSKTLEEQQNQATTAAAQLTERTAKFDEDDKAHVAEKAALAEQKKQVEEAMDAAAKEADAQVKKLKSDLNTLTNVKDDLADQIDQITRTTFEVSDGEIRWVNQRNGTVWINLGRADNLPKQTPFSVFGRDENDVARTDSKAKIEVTQILGDHLAEARIVEDAAADPIMPGDKIYTPLWHPGRVQHFALAGFMDINDDEESDRELIKDLIAMSGAVLDAELTDDGKVVGPGMSVETRYLVLGEAPQEKEANSRFATIAKDAEKLNVAVITLDKFLDHMGWKDPSRLVTFGRHSDPRQFPPITTDKSRQTKAPGSITSGVFKKREARSLHAKPKEETPAADSAYE
jgi:chemotaxis protein histidine kinase CheA